MANYISTHTGAEIDAAVDRIGDTTIMPCTKEQYDAWKEAGTLDPNTLYFYPEVTS